MAKIDKKKLSESDICSMYIRPAIVKAGWDSETDIRQEVTFTDGRVITRGKHHSRGKQKRADFILNHQNIRLAIVEAKKNTRPVGHGMQQAIQYGEILQVPFVFTSNGDGFVLHDRLATTGPVEQQLSLDEFPSPEQLIRRYQKSTGLTDEGLALVTQDYYTDASGKEPRYYQVNAITRTLEAIARGQDRILLVMATGTGKTYTAFQIIWRLWKAKAKKRILFLVDRNILADQAKTNDFKPFGGAMTKISKRKIDKSFEIYLSLYQAVTGTEEERNIYKEFSPDFFDLVVIDECHRGSASEASAWRQILDYFSSATHIGLTATPKETKDVSNINYFGEPVYSYSLKRGIDDGFLAPYRVIRLDLDKDLGWRPQQGQTDKHGELIEDRVYNLKDMDRSLVLEQRTELVARKITEFLRGTNRHDKTIVFCENIDHAERMRRALVNENGDLVAQDRRYVMRITGDEKEGKQELDNFIDPEAPCPVIATTSKLLTTGVDARTCKLIVLDQQIGSMTEFKQIIGRGTRIYRDEGNEVCPEKLSFTILDFRRATELFADPDFDGPPEVIYEPGEDDSIVPPDDYEGGDGPEGEGGGEAPELDQSGVGLEHLNPKGDGDKPRRYVVNDVPVFVASERIQYYDADGKLITESLKDYTSKRVKSAYHSLDLFLQSWSEADKKAAIVRELENQGIVFKALAEEVGKDIGPFDLICHVVYGQPPLTRRERVDNVRKRDYFTKYGDEARAVLNALLDKFSDGGLDDIESMSVLKVQPISEFGSVREIVDVFGGKDGYKKAIRELESGVGGPVAPAVLLGDRRLVVVVHQLGLILLSVEDLEEEHPAQLADALGVAIDTGVLAEDVLDGLDRGAEGHAPEGMTGDALLEHVEALFKSLKSLKSLRTGPKSNPRAAVVRSVFEDAYNYQKSGQLLRQVVNKLNEIDFTRSADFHQFGSIYEKILSDLRGAGNAGEYYTPRGVTQFIVDMVDPKLGEKVLDPACGTGGFLTCAIEHVRAKQVKTAKQRAKLQRQFFGVEKKPMPHMLCVTNMLLHGIEVPDQIRHDNTLERPLRDYKSADRVNVIITNPPFGGMEEDGIENNFPAKFRTRETADLFLVLIIHLLKKGGRGALVLPDGTLFGDGVKARVKQNLLEVCNLHTIVRLPKGVFSPYTSIKTNLLFFTKGEPTKEIWFYEHPYPEGYKSYSKTKPLRIEEFEPEKVWWNDREENEFAWRVPVEQVVENGYNLDLKNPHEAEAENLDPDVLIAQYKELVKQVEKAQNKLRDELGAALAGGAK